MEMVYVVVHVVSRDQYTFNKDLQQRARLLALFLYVLWTSRSASSVNEPCIKCFSFVYGYVTVVDDSVLRLEVPSLCKCAFQSKMEVSKFRASQHRDIPSALNYACIVLTRLKG